MFLPVLTMAVAQFFDFGTFFVMVRRHGPAAEANPLVASILEDLGMPAVALTKAALVLLVAAITLILANHRRPATASPRLASVVLGAAILAGLIGGGINALTIGPI